MKFIKDKLYMSAGQLPFLYEGMVGYHVTEGASTTCFIHMRSTGAGHMTYKFLDDCIDMSWQECGTRLTNATN